MGVTLIFKWDSFYNRRINNDKGNNICNTFSNGFNFADLKIGK